MTYPQRTVAPLGKRLFTKFKIGDDCWEWTGAKDPKGYGKVTRGRSGEGTMLSHRAVYEFLVGKIPEGLVLDHLCRNPSCVKPTHLEPVTQRENTVRGVGPASRSKWTSCSKGHEYTESNTHFQKNGTRACKKCHAIWERERQRKIREQF